VAYGQQSLIYIPGRDPIPVRATQQRSWSYNEHPFANKFVWRDPDTGLITIPPYASRLDDHFMRCITRGVIGNVGIAPVIDSQLVSIVTRRQAMAQTWQFMVEGPDSSREALKRVMSQANDGEGAAAFAGDVVGALDVDNVGAFISELPINKLLFEDWDKYGIEAIPIVDAKGKPKKGQYYLSISNDDYRNLYGLWSLDGMLCSPTGNRDWPFWFTPLSKSKGGLPDDATQVLIPGDVGFQVIQKAGPKWGTYAGYGQSGTWRYTGVMVENTIIQEGKIESFLNAPPRGFVIATSVDQPGQFKRTMTDFKNEKKENDILYDPGTVYMEFANKDGDVKIRPWSEPPAYFTEHSWKTFREDALASCFHVSVAFLVTRIGTGAFSQSDVTAEIQAETGLAWIQHIMETIFSSLGSPRTRVIVNIPSDKQKKQQVETAKNFADALKIIQDAGAKLQSNQIQELFQTVTGFELPEAIMDEVEDETNEEEVAAVSSGEKAPAQVTQSVNGHGQLALATNGASH